jgi:hypothetical protein
VCERERERKQGVWVYYIGIGDEGGIWPKGGTPNRNALGEASEMCWDIWE